MTISIEAITFNHTPLSADSALPIRKNQSEDVAVPEWRGGMSRPEQSPAAYTINQLGNRLTIKVKFRREASDRDGVTVHAVARPGNVLGDVRPQTINFGMGLASGNVLFELNLPGAPVVGVTDVVWDWHVNGVLFETTQHRIYTLVKEPQEPWGRPGSNFQVPWTEVLDHACLQAAGARTEDQAAEELTKWLFRLGDTKLQYREGTGYSTFTVPGMKTFKCTEFLNHLAAAPGEKKKVNCTDCATIVSSFANILGCNLTQSQIGYEFDTNLVRKIGLNYPRRADFNFHEVAWKFPTNGTAEAFVYDPCLQLDGDNDLYDNNFQPTLGIKMPLGGPGREGYHFRLIASRPSAGSKVEQPTTRVRRKIDGTTTTRMVRAPEQQQRLRNEHDFGSWRGPATEEPIQHCKANYIEEVSPAPAPVRQEEPTSDQQLLVNYSSNLKHFAPRGWRLRKAEHLKAEPDPFQLTDAIWEPTECSGAELRVVTYECSSIAAARSFLLNLLGEFEVPSIKRRLSFIVNKKPVEIGDVAFADVDELVVLFARGNLVVLIQNAAPTVVPVSRFAHEIDADIAHQPDSDKPHSDKEGKQFAVPDHNFQVRDRIPLQYHGGSITKETETVFKFFAPSGQVFLDGGDLFYRPAAEGEQSISILALKAGTPTVRQVVNVSVEQPLSIQETGCRKLDKDLKEEDSVMPDISGSWSLRRLTNNGHGSADLNVDGFVQIDVPDDNGDIKGSYADFDTHTVEAITGHVSYLSGNSFSVILRHKTPSGNMREYKGQLVEGDQDGVQLVVGRYRNYTRPNGSSPNTVIALDGQEGGIWVATKP